MCPAQSVRTLKVSCNVEQQSDKNTNKQKDKQGKGAIGQALKQNKIKVQKDFDSNKMGLTFVNARFN